jgi:hypothetical protein
MLKKLIFVISLMLIIGKNILAEESLEVTLTHGHAPLKVQIKGPSRLTAKGSGQYSKFVGCGFDINWGDNTGEPIELLTKSCSNGLVHTFLAPGKYKIKAKTFYPNPDDTHVTDWTGQTQVIVQ